MIGYGINKIAYTMFCGRTKKMHYSKFYFVYLVLNIGDLFNFTANYKYIANLSKNKILTSIK
ncbi:hypothetical protein DBR43_32035 [Pedobacter sp. KBW06]|nr:hypothetical protein DBR43_32035 [Pedobacter sp. KBW06]